MRSPAERRVVLERVLRGAAWAALAWLVWLAARGPAGGRRALVDGAALGEALPRWTAQPPAESLVLALAAAPPPPLRDWLVALRRGGTAVAWRGSVAPLAAAAAWSADPVAALRVRVAAPRGARVSLRDSLGEVASGTAEGGGAGFTVAPGSARLVVALGRSAAALAIPPRPERRRIAVLGRAEWETKFVVTALEERGWLLDTRSAVAPGIAVVQGAPWPPDTARHDAVVALDSLGSREAAALAAYVRRGGGLVLGPAAARSPALRELLPARVERRERPRDLAVAAEDPRAALPVDRLTPGAAAAVLERRDGAAAVAARRWYAGRVVQLGYDDTWRWRLAGGDHAPDDHRAWWSALVSAAAAEPLEPESRAAADPAPLASLTLALGPALPGAAADRPSGSSSRFVALVCGVFLTALLAEWASRRARGAA